jgi:hypothetical protein
MGGLVWRTLRRSLLCALMTAMWGCVGDDGPSCWSSVNAAVGAVGLYLLILGSFPVPSGGEGRTEESHFWVGDGVGRLDGLGVGRGRIGYRPGSLRSSTTMTVDHPLYQLIAGTYTGSAKYTHQRPTHYTSIQIPAKNPRSHLDSIIINRINTAQPKPNTNKHQHRPSSPPFLRFSF